MSSKVLQDVICIASYHPPTGAFGPNCYYVNGTVIFEGNIVFVDKLHESLVTFYTGYPPSHFCAFLDDDFLRCLDFSDPGAQVVEIWMNQVKLIYANFAPYYLTVDSAGAMSLFYPTTSVPEIDFLVTIPDFYFLPMIISIEAFLYARPPSNDQIEVCVHHLPTSNDTCVAVAASSITAINSTSVPTILYNNATDVYTIFLDMLTSSEEKAVLIFTYEPRSNDVRIKFPDLGSFASSQTASTSIYFDSAAPE